MKRIKVSEYRVRTKTIHTVPFVVGFGTKHEAKRHATSEKRYMKEMGATGRVSISRWYGKSRLYR